MPNISHIPQTKNLMAFFTPIIGIFLVFCGSSESLPPTQSSVSSTRESLSDLPSIAGRASENGPEANAVFAAAAAIMQDGALKETERRQMLGMLRRSYGDQLFFSIIYSVPTYRTEDGTTITFYEHMKALASSYDFHVAAPMAYDPVGAATRIFLSPTEEVILRMTGAGISDDKIAQYSEQYRREANDLRRKITPEYDVTLNAAVLLVRSSTSNNREAERRVDALEEVRQHIDNGDLDGDRALFLLDILVPDAAINERKAAARRLAQLSEDGSQWDVERRMQAADEIATLVMGKYPNSKQRIEAARELVTKLDAGDLEPQDALDLMDRISPGTAIKQRAQALGSIARRFGEDGSNWDAQDLEEFADELHTVTFGDSLNYEKRGSAAVDLASEGIKSYGGDSYDDDDIDNAGRLIKEAAFGDSGSLQDAVEDIFGD